MHLDFHFTVVQTLWMLTFAAELVLLVVLLGRDRAKRYPWFTIAITLMALRLLAIKLLGGRLSELSLTTIFIAMADVSAVAGVLVVVEIARRAFAPVRRLTWFAWALGLLAIGGVILWKTGPWPAWKTLQTSSFIGELRLGQLGAQKLDMLTDLLTVGLGVLVVLLGRRFGAGWRSHTQRIVIGLSTASIAQLAVQAIWLRIAHNTIPHSQAEYDRVIALRDKFFNANGALYVAILIWWIVVLWMDEPGTAAIEAAEGKNPQAEYLATDGANSTAGLNAGEVAEE
jgi:hypothetical protein